MNFEIQDRRKRTFVMIYTDVLKGPFVKMSGSAFKVYVALLARANNETHECRPSRKTIAADCGVSPETITRCFKELTEAGLITVQARADDDTGQQTSHLITILETSNISTPPRQNDDPPSSNLQGGVVKFRHELDVSELDLGELEATPPVLAPPEIPPEQPKPKAPSLAQEFVALYCQLANIPKVASYPKSIGQANLLVKAGIQLKDFRSLYDFSNWGEGTDLGKMLAQVDRWRQKRAQPRPLPYVLAERKRIWDEEFKGGRPLNADIAADIVRWNDAMDWLEDQAMPSALRLRFEKCFEERLVTKAPMLPAFPVLEAELAAWGTVTGRG